VNNDDILSKLEPNLIIQSDLKQIIHADLPWDQLAGKTILVTGGGGFLASYLVKSLLALNEINHLNLKVVCAVRSLNGVQKRLSTYMHLSSLTIIQHDITEPLSSNFPLVDLIIHSASQASPKFYGTDPVGTLKANSIGTMYLLDHAVKCNSQKLLFFSSGEVYGELINPDQEISEIDYGYVDPMLVRSCYAESKRVGENMCVSWYQQYGLHTTVVRPFHTYGPGMALDDGRVFADFVSDVVASRDIVLRSDGLARRPFCYIADATLGFLTVLLKGGAAHAYNVANPSAEISMIELANTLSGLFPERGVNVKFQVLGSTREYLKSPIRRQCPTINKILGLDWHPVIGIEAGFYRTIKSYL
jgi:UDP-glucuronate decarboxylase